MSGEDGWQCRYEPGPYERDDMSLEDWVRTIRALYTARKYLLIAGG